MLLQWSLHLGGYQVNLWGKVWEIKENIQQCTPDKKMP